MTRPVRLTLGVLAVLQVLAAAVCVLLAIWGGDDRWGMTAGLLAFTALITAAAVTLP